MSLIDRYIIRSHIAPFIFGTGTVIFILLMQFLMISLGDLVGKGLSEWLIIKLIVFNMAWMVILAVPMGVLFSTLMSFGSMSMAHETTIVKASGGSFIRMLAPVLFSGFMLYLGLFYFNDVILPESNHQVKIMMNDIQRKKPTFALESGLFSTQLDGYTILARNVDSASGGLSGVTIYDMTKFQNRNIISSDSGWISFTPDYKKLVLDLKDGEIHQFLVNTVDNYKIIRFSDYRIAMNAYGFAFEQSRSDMVSKGDREMNITDMQAIVDTAESNKRNILKRVDSLVANSINDLIFGKPKLKIDTTIITEANTDKVLVKTKNKAKPKVSAKTNTEIVIQDEEALAKNKIKKLDTGMTLAEQVRAKFNKAVTTGNTDLKSEKELTDKSKQQIQIAMQKEKIQLKEDSIKKALLEQSQAKVVIPKKKKETKPKIELDKGSIKRDTIITVNSISNMDTSYNEVLSRVLQQANLSKSTIQADINNVKFFENRSKQYRVEIYKKYSLPFACLIFVLVGAPLGIITKGGNFGISAAISLVFYVFYWACLIGGEKLGDRGLIAPWLAMWMANIVVGIIGILLIIRVNNESLKFGFTFFKKKKLA